MASALKGGRYEIERELGRGGMGVVYLARDTRLPRRVALKMLPREITHDAELRRRLAQEARAASTLNHPGVATVYDFEEHGEESFIVFEYVEGASLRERISRRRLTTEEILDIGIELADALAAAHECGIIHRDLKPENILLTAGAEGASRVKILDFGLAKLRRPLTAAGAGASAAETASLSTAAGLLVGTVNYMAPEQLEGEAVDARTDVYALGLVLYETATGVNPFVGKTHTSTIANVLKQEAPPVAERNPVAPAELDRIVRKCLRKWREERYQSARELLVDLANLRRDLALPAGQKEGVLWHDARRGSMVFSRGAARAVLAAIQAGYLVIYTAALNNFEAIERLAVRLYDPRVVLVPWSLPGYATYLVMAGALVGIVVRLYLLSAVAADYPDLGRKYRLLFPPTAFLDIVWAVSPLLLHEKMGMGLALACVAGLAYLPFVQYRLVYDAYSASGGRSSGVRAAPGV